MAGEPHGSGARRVAKNTAMLASARIIERATTLVLTLVIAAKLGADGVGVYATAMAIYGIIAIAGEAGATSYLIRELSRDRGLTSSYVFHLSVVGIVVAGAVTLVAYVLIHQVGYDAELTASVSVVLLAIVPKTLNSIQEGTFVAHGRTELQAIATLVGNLAFVVAGTYLLARGHGVQAVLQVFVALQWATALAYHFLIARHIAASTWRFEWTLARRLIGEVKVFTASSVLGALFARPEVVILSLFASTTEVGYFSAAMRVAEIWVFVPQVFMNNVYALLSEAHQRADGRFRAIQERATKLILAYTLPLTAGLAAGAGAIIPALFGDGFEPAVDALRLMAVALTFHGLLEVYWRSLAARDRQDAVLRVQLVMVVARLGGGALIIAPLAALGAAIATMANTGLQLLLLARSAGRHDAPASVFRIGWRIGLSSAIMGGLVWLLAEKIELWALVPFGAIAYAVALVALRAFTPDELRQIRSSLPGRAAPMAG